MELEYLYWLLLLLLFGRALGEVFRRFKFEPLIGEVLAGLILGPAILGLIVIQEGTENPLEYFSQFGILMLMLLAGLTTDFSSFAENKMSSLVISVAGVLASFSLVYFPLHYLLGIDFIASLFIAAVLSNTAIEVSARILMHSENQKIKAVIIGASFIDDIIAVFLIGIVSSKAVLDKDPGAMEIAWLAARVIIFLFITLIVVSWPLEKLFDRLLKSTEEGKLILTSTFILTFLFALIANQVGLHFVIGAYISGLLIGKWGSKIGPLLRRRITRRKLVEDIDAPLRAVFSPIFFGFIGLSASIIIDGGDTAISDVVPLIMILSVLAILGKVVGCGFGAKICRFKGRESITIGTAMCGRGALELVLLSFGLENEVITEPLFISLVIVTLITIILTPILYTLSIKFSEKRKISEEDED